MSDMKELYIPATIDNFPKEANFDEDDDDGFVSAPAAFGAARADSSSRTRPCSRRQRFAVTTKPIASAAISVATTNFLLSIHAFLCAKAHAVTVFFRRKMRWFELPRN